LALGSTSVGKTSLLYQYTDGTFNDKFVSTVGIDFRTKRLIYRMPIDSNGILGKEQKIQLQLWDTAGQERFRSLSTTFLRDAMGFMLVFDITNEESFNQIRGWLTLLRTHAYCAEPDIVLVGNKVDLDAQRCVSQESGQSLADELGIPYIETSALSGENVEVVVNRLLDLIMARIEKSVDKTRLPARRVAGLPKAKTNEDSGSSCGC
jgi:Ras-related protein Rab-27A